MPTSALRREKISPTALAELSEIRRHARGSMRVHVIGNAAFDEALAVETWPVPGASILCRPLASGPGGKGLNQAVALARAGSGGAAGRGRRRGRARGGDPRGAGRRAAGGGAGGDARRRATDASLVLSAPDGDNCNITTTECAEALTPEAVRAALDGAAAGRRAAGAGQPERGGDAGGAGGGGRARDGAGDEPLAAPAVAGGAAGGLRDGLRQRRRGGGAGQGVAALHAAGAGGGGGDAGRGGRDGLRTGRGRRGAGRAGARCATPPGRGTRSSARRWPRRCCGARRSTRMRSGRARGRRRSRSRGRGRSRRCRRGRSSRRSCGGEPATSDEARRAPAWAGAPVLRLRLRGGDVRCAPAGAAGRRTPCWRTARDAGDGSAVPEALERSCAGEPVEQVLPQPPVDRRLAEGRRQPVRADVGGPGGGAALAVVADDEQRVAALVVGQRGEERRVRP